MLNSPLIAELRRRRVFRVGGMYVAAVLAGLQAVQLFQEALGLPDLLRLLAVASIVGFPVALALAWAFQRTADGVVQDETFTWSPTQIAIATAATAGTLGLAGLLLVSGPIASAGEEASREPAGSNIHERRVAIIPFTNATGNPALDALGASIADYVANALLETQLVEISDPLTVQAAVVALAAANNPSESTRQFGEETGAAYLVRGTINPRGDFIELAAQVTDSRQGTVLESLEPIRAPLDDPLAAAVPMRSRLQTSLAGILEPSLADFEGSFADPPTYEAYQAHLEGLATYLDGRYSDSYPLFARAVELDPGFLQASKWQLFTSVFTQPEPVRDSLYEWLDSRRESLSVADRHQLDFFAALDGRPDWEASYQAARARLAAAPGSDDARRELALAAYRTRRFQEATEHLLALDPQRGLMQSWTDYWGELATTYLNRGMADSALIVLEAAPPEARTSSAWQREFVPTLVALGRESELQAWARTPEFEGGELAYAGLLALRGSAEELAWVASRPGLSRITAAAISYYQGDLARADSVVSAFLSADPSGPASTGLSVVLVLVREAAGRDTSDLEDALRRDTERGLLRAGNATIGLARLEMLRGNRAAALSWLEQAPGGSIARLVADPVLGNLAGSPEFEALLTPHGGS